MKGFHHRRVLTTLPTASPLVAAAGSCPAKRSVAAGSLWSSSCQATVSAVFHLMAVTATPVLELELDPRGAAVSAPPVLAPPPGAGAGDGSGEGALPVAPPPSVVSGRRRAV